MWKVENYYCAFLKSIKMKEEIFVEIYKRDSKKVGTLYKL